MKLSLLTQARATRRQNTLLTEFSAAAIELERTPASRTGHIITYAIIGLFLAVVIWAAVGHVDIVAVAQGKVIPKDGVKQIQPIEVAVVSNIHVKEGQTVRAGEPLISFDNTQAGADVTRVSQELAEGRADVARWVKLDAWLKATEDGENSPFETSVQDEEVGAMSQHLLLQQQIQEIRVKLAGFNNERQKLDAERKMALAESEKKLRVIPILKQRVDALDTLQKKSYASKLQFLELEQQLIEEEQELLVQQARERQMSVAIAGVTLQQETFIAEQRRIALDQLQQLRTRNGALVQELIKAQQRERQHVLLAPIAGEVQQLAINTVGGVVTPAQVLMQIVPADGQLEVEAMILNKDIGFVNEGQSVKIKVDTFNFTKHGFIEGELVNLSDDAITHDDLGLVYRASIQLKQQHLEINGKPVKLSSGMSVVAEIATGTRRIIEFFLSPLLRYQQESLGER